MNIKRAANDVVSEEKQEEHRYPNLDFKTFLVFCIFYFDQRCKINGFAAWVLPNKKGEGSGTHLVISAPESLDLVYLRGNVRPKRFHQRPTKAEVASASPNSVGKTQVLSLRAADRKTHTLLLCARGRGFKPRPDQYSYPNPFPRG